MVAKWHKKELREDELLDCVKACINEGADSEMRWLRPR